MYKLTNYLQKYMRSNGKIELSEEQFNLMFELLYAFHTLEQNDTPPDSSEEVQKFRMDICKGCSNFKDEKTWITCTLCGCDLDYKTKLSIEKCPVNKWFIDLETLKKQFKETIEYLNSKADTDFYNSDTVEQDIARYRQIIESGAKHE